MTEIQASKVHFYFLNNLKSLKNRNKLKEFLKGLARSYNKQIGELNYIFCSDDYLLDINRKFLNHDYYTDIITFDLSENQHIHGEIYISIDRVKDNSKKYNTPFIQELHRVIFHGLLHLCGFKDKTDKERVDMRKHEQLNLDNYFK